MNGKMVELFLKSYGAPKPVIELLRRFQAMGLGALKTKRMAADDPTWALIKADPAKQQGGLWMRAEGPNSRVTVAILLEGDNDEAMDILGSLDGGSAMRGDLRGALPSNG